MRSRNPARLPALIYGASLSLACAAAAAQPAQTIYVGGDILTMKGPKPVYAQALAVRDGKIAAVGARDAVMRLKGTATEVVDLKGRTLLPGFLDTHGHMIYFGKNLMDADLFGSRDVADLIARMKAHVPKMPQGAWIVGFGYGARSLKEGRAPTIEELDAVSADRPVLIVDSSGHLGSANSAAYRAAGIDASTPDPEGGSFARKADGRALAGPLEETALNALRRRRPPFTGELADRVATEAARLWMSYGQTTAMDCGVGLGDDDVDLVHNAIDRQLLPIDLYVCSKDSAVDAVAKAAAEVRRDYANAPSGSIEARQGALVDQARAAGGGTRERLLALRADLDARYVNRVRLGGIKFWLDGSLDTAWFTQPYSTNPPGKTGTYSGFRQVPDEVVDAAFDRYWTSGVQINLHTNGDAAVEQALRSIERAIARHGRADHRPVFVHGTYMRPDQVERMKAVGAVPSFLTSSIVTNGDAVVRMWGKERAYRSMAANTLSRKGLPFTFSHDAPVSPQPWILALVDAGVNRTTASGQVVGPAERVSPYVALQAVTSMAAYQIKEEGTKGTLEPGKLADLVILGANPLKVPPRTIKDIPVLETVKEGRVVWKAGR
ncbi:MAG: amidohydrolase [Burkholderiales bacterium]